MSIGVLLTIINLGVYLFVIFLCLRKWKQSTAIRRFFWVLVLTFLWIVDSFVEGLNKDAYHFLAYTNFALAAFIAASMATFSIHFPGANVKFTQKKEFILWTPIIVIASLSYAGVFVKPTGYQIVEKTSAYWVYMATLFFYFIGISGYTLAKKLHNATGIERKQLKGFTLGYLLAICVLLGESIYVNTVKGISIATDQVIYNVSILFSGIAAYSILRFRFLNFRLSIQRGAIRLLSFLLIFGLYLLSILLVHESIRPQTREGDMIFLIIVTIIIVLTVEPIRKFVFRKVDSLFDSHEEQQRRTRERICLATTTQQTHEALMATALDLVRETSGFQDVSFVEARAGFFHAKIATRSYLERYGRVLVTGELPYRLEEHDTFQDIVQELKGSGVGLLLPIGKGELFMGSFIIRNKQNDIFPSQTIQALKDLQFQISDAIIGARLYKQAVERIKV